MGKRRDSTDLNLQLNNNNNKSLLCSQLQRGNPVN
jgi:hypothetical protein